ncbi:MAG: AMP-binding protein [Candidatus Promineifilaceae bacterium]
MTPERLGLLGAELGRRGGRPAAGLRGAYGSRWWSYRRLQEESGRFAASLQAWGVGRGSRLLLWAPNSPEWLAVLLGALGQGVTVVPVDEGTQPEHVARLAQEAQAAGLVHGQQQPAAGLAIPAYRIESLFDDGRPAGRPPRPAAVDPGHPALIMYTSGSTREPKGVILTHANLEAQLAAFARWRWLARLMPVRMLCLSPLSHVQGLVVGGLVPLWLGLSVLYSSEVDPVHVMRAIRQERISALLAVPRLQHQLAEALRNLPAGRPGLTLAERVAKVRFFPLRRHILFLASHRQLGYRFYVLLVGGAALPPADERFWYECGLILVQGYGLTETAALASVKVNSPFFARLGSIGRPLPRSEVRLSAEGEILIKGAAVSPGYFRRAEALAGQDGFLATGDLAERDAAGRLYFRGRKSERIVTGEGHNVYPQDVEAVLNRLAGVRDSVVLALAADGGAQVHAVLLLADGVEAAPLVAQANTRLQAHQQIRSWSVWPQADLPRTSLLKARREAVAAGLAQGRPARPPANGGRPGRPSLATLLQTAGHEERLAGLADYLSGGSPAAEEEGLRLADLGLSSLDVVALLARLERAQQRGLEGASAGPATTLAELRRQLDAAQPNGPGSALPSRQPGWSAAWPGRALRRLSQPVLIGLWSRLSVQLELLGRDRLSGQRGPWLIAAAPHHNWLDAFLVYAALPGPGRRRLVTVTNRDFSEFFAPAPAVAPPIRRQVGLAYYLLWPLVFEFVIVPNSGSTRQGLLELGRAIGRGYSPITFPKGLVPPDKVGGPKHEPGMAAVALETGLSILPVWLEGHHDLTVWPLARRPRLKVCLGEPLKTGPWLTPGQVVAQVEAAFRALAAEAKERP